jgi:hypothetical protein
VPLLVAFVLSGIGQNIPEPLSFEKVMYLLKGSVRAERVATLVRERGISFSLSTEMERQLHSVLRQNGATRESSDDLFAALREAASKRATHAASADSLQGAQNSPQAERELALKYENGSGGLAKDAAQAAYWFRKAAEQGDSVAEYDLASMYENGQGGLPKDDTQAVYWYLAAADQGNAAAQSQLGLMYENGRGGLTKDDAQASYWFRKAAAQGEPSATHKLDDTSGQAKPQPASKPNFSGTWLFNPRKSTLQDPPPSKLTLQIEQRGSLVKMSRIQAYGDKIFNSTINATTDGQKEVVQTFAMYSSRARVYWEGDSLVVDEKITANDGSKATNLVKYSLSGAGTELLAVEDEETPNGKITNNWRYDKIIQ